VGRRTTCTIAYASALPVNLLLGPRGVARPAPQPARSALTPAPLLAVVGGCRWWRHKLA
jgi:hypothetical protein